MIAQIIVFGITSFLIYFGIACLLTVAGAPKKGTRSSQNNILFDELNVDYTHLPELQQFKARDGAKLSFRYYPSQSENILILLHGSGWHSQYFLPIAEFISSNHLAQVYTPDLRGHGTTPHTRGDIDYIDQLEDDLADLLSIIQQTSPKARIIIGGHSSGGGLAVRFAGSQYGTQANAYLLFTPFLKYNAPTMKKNSGGWALPFTFRIIGLSMLNNAGIHWFDYLPVISFNMPAAFRNGTETLIYSHRLNTGYAPRNFKTDLGAMDQPLLVLAGRSDESFVPEQFEPVISKYTKAQVLLFEDVTHMGIVMGTKTYPAIKKWFEHLS